MNILLIAPQPFFVERGTPIAVRWVAETLCKAGHHVDLLCYPQGNDITLPGLRIFRSHAPKAIGAIPIGFSWKKLVCDIFLTAKMFRLAAQTRYEVIHAGEESIFPATLLRRTAGPRLVYDMDSSMADQLTEKWPRLRLLAGLFNGFEKRAIKAADLILPVCERLADKARACNPRGHIHVLHDRALDSDLSAPADNLRAGSAFQGPLLLYVGNLEHYQGIDMLVETLPLVRTRSDWKVLIVGGSETDILRLRTRAAELDVDSRIEFTGPRPVSALDKYLLQADILLSPRTKGDNTPLKIYSYMMSGKPIIATAIPSHTQVLHDESAILAPPSPAGLAAAIDRALGNPGEIRRIAQEARRMALVSYTREAYENNLLSAYAKLSSHSHSNYGRGAR